MNIVGPCLYKDGGMSFHNLSKKVGRMGGRTRVDLEFYNKKEGW